MALRTFITLKYFCHGDETHFMVVAQTLIYITGVTLSLLCALSLHSYPIQQQHEKSHKPSLDILRSRCIPLIVLLKADPSLEGDIADEKADPSACHQLGQVTVLQYFQGTAGSMKN